MRVMSESGFLSLLAQDNFDTFHLLESFDDDIHTYADHSVPFELLSPPTVPSQCCALANRSASHHNAIECATQGNDRDSNSHPRGSASGNQLLGWSSGQQGSGAVSSSPPYSATTSSSSSFSLLSPPVTNTALDYYNYDAPQKHTLTASKPQIKISCALPQHVRAPSSEKHPPPMPTDDEVKAGHSSGAANSISVQLPSKMDFWNGEAIASTQRGKDLITCDVPGCNRVFANVYNLNDHRRTHVRPRERPHSCPLAGCPKSYFYRRDLVRHLRKHHFVTASIPPRNPHLRRASDSI